MWGKLSDRTQKGILNSFDRWIFLGSQICFGKKISLSCRCFNLTSEKKFLSQSLQKLTLQTKKDEIKNEQRREKVKIITKIMFLYSQVCFPSSSHFTE